MWHHIFISGGLVCGVWAAISGALAYHADRELKRSQLRRHMIVAFKQERKRESLYSLYFFIMALFFVNVA